jgi:hypothetical protein
MDTSNDRIVNTLQQVNRVMGIEVFNRIHELPNDVLDEFCLLLNAGRIDLHREGYRGFTAELADGSWTNEGFEL